MNIERFSAPTMRGAMAEVRRKLGAEAVIVHSQAGDEGVEVVAAVDYDESLASLSGAGPTQEPAARRQAREHEQREALDAAVRLMGRKTVRDSMAPSTELDVEDGTPLTVKLYDRTGRENVAALAAAADSVRAAEPPLGLAGLAPVQTSTGPAHKSSGAGAAGRVPGDGDRLDDVGAELRSLRTLMEQQLSGLAWQDVANRDPQRAHVLRRLLDFGLEASLCTSIADAMRYHKAPQDTWQEAKRELALRIPDGRGYDVLAGGGVVALVGPTGVGKTTTVAKLAGSYIQRHGPGSVGLVTTDDYRLGAYEQLQAFGRILDISVARARDEASLMSAVRGFQNRSLVLVDTEGAEERIDDQASMFDSLAMADLPVRGFLLLAANTQRAALLRTAALFSRMPLHGAIITKADECGNLGEVLSTIIATQLPMSYLSDGQQVPQDLHSVDANEIIRRGEAMLANISAEDQDEILGITFGNMVAAKHG